MIKFLSLFQQHKGLREIALEMFKLWVLTLDILSIIKIYKIICKMLRLTRMLTKF